jgi:hypothetical protein
MVSRVWVNAVPCSLDVLEQLGHSGAQVLRGNKEQVQVVCTK